MIAKRDFGIDAGSAERSGLGRRNQRDHTIPRDRYDSSFQVGTHRDGLRERDRQLNRHLRRDFRPEGIREEIREPKIGEIHLDEPFPRKREMNPSKRRLVHPLEKLHRNAGRLEHHSVRRAKILRVAQDIGDANRKTSRATGIDKAHLEVELLGENQ